MTIVINENSYVDVATADAYFLDRYGYDQWDGQTEPQKESALISATAQLDAMCAWYGYPSDSAQALAFPRKPNADPVPEGIKISEMEIAYSMVVSGSANVTSEDPLTKLVAGDVELEFKGVGGKTNSLVNDYSKSLLAPYGICNFGSGTKIVDVERA